VSAVACPSSRVSCPGVEILREIGTATLFRKVKRTLPPKHLESSIS
jgi:hypothetical protein